MKNTELKKLFDKEPDQWVVYQIRTDGAYIKNSCPDWSARYKLIRKEHENIADYYIANPHAEIEFRWHDEPFMPFKNFLEEYEADAQYRLANHFIKTVQYYNDNTGEMFIVEQKFVSEDAFKEATKDCIKIKPLS